MCCRPDRYKKMPRDAEGRVKPLRSIIIACFFLSVFLMSAVSGAHAPNAIHAGYDVGRGELSIIVEHLVNNKWNHFVKEVVVYRNGQEAWRQGFDFQTSFRNLTVPPISITAIDGDAFRIVASCSEGGAGEKTIAVGVLEREATTGPVEHDIEK